MLEAIPATFWGSPLHESTALPYFLFLCRVLDWTWHISHSFQSLLHCSSVGQLGIDIRPGVIDSIPTCLRAIKLSARIYSRWAERKAKKLSPPAHVRGQRVKKGSAMEARVWGKVPLDGRAHSRRWNPATRRMRILEKKMKEEMIACYFTFHYPACHCP